MWDATNNKSSGLKLTAINELRKRVDYIINYIFVFLILMVVLCIRV